MARGFIYVMTTLTKDYVQKAFCNVPTQWGDRLYFGPCKIPMRPKMKPGDVVFGISPSGGTRRIVFVAELEERITFAEAYDRFPELRAPQGPILVKPVNGWGRFPESSYEPIPGQMHRDGWKADLASKQLDAFFVCSKREGSLGRWLGKYGPQLDDETLAFLKKCSLHGPAGVLSQKNKDATSSNPIHHGGLNRGLHLETDEPETLIELCAARSPEPGLLDRVLTPARQSGVCGECGVQRRAPQLSSKKPILLIKRKC
jgi:hypothetical protein